MSSLKLHTVAKHVPGLLDAARVLWLVPHQMLMAFAVCLTAAGASILAARSSVRTRRSLAERAALSGHGLSLASVQFGRRGGAPPPMCLTERDLRLMAQLLDVNYLTTSQLVVLGWGASGLRAAQKRLKVLHDAGYIDRVGTPVCAKAPIRLESGSSSRVASAFSRATGAWRRHRTCRGDCGNARRSLRRGQSCTSCQRASVQTSLKARMLPGEQPDPHVRESTVSRDRSAHAIRDQRPASAHIDNGRSTGRPAAAEDVLTVSQVAELFQLSPRTVSEHGARGVLPSVKIGRHRRFSRRQLEALVGGRRL